MVEDFYEMMDELFQDAMHGAVADQIADIQREVQEIIDDAREELHVARHTVDHDDFSPGPMQQLVVNVLRSAASVVLTSVMRWRVSLRVLFYACVTDRQQGQCRSETTTHPPAAAPHRRPP